MVMNDDKLTRTLRRIRHTGPVLRRLDPATIADALGADAAGLELRPRGSPVAVFQMRTALMSRLQASGGGPVLEGANRRIEIPVTDSQWQELEDLAASFSDVGFTPSPGQVASVLLSLALPLVKKETERLQRELASIIPSVESSP
jgi:hypothetical protein